MSNDYMSGLSVLKFSAEWCAPCKRMQTIIDKMGKEFPDITIYNVDIDTDFEVAKKYNIKSVPTIVFFKEGKQLNKIEGLEKTDAVRKAFKGLQKEKELEV